MTSDQLPARLGQQATTGSLSVCFPSDTYFAPPTHAHAITPSNTASQLASASIGVTIGGAGNLVFCPSGMSGSSITLPVAGGQFVYGSFLYILSGTTATNIVGWTP